jgi:predicted Zn-dependent protease
MSSKKSARQFAETKTQTQNSTTSLFIKNHTSPEQLLAQIEVLFDQGHLHEANHAVECIIDHYNPLISSADLFTLHAKIYIELFGFNVHAQSSIQQALLLEPNHEEAIALQKVSALHEELRDGLYESAEEGLRSFISTHTENTYAMYVLANHLFWKNGPEVEAVELLEKVVKNRPSFLKAWLSLAMAYKKCLRPVKAEAAFLECLGLDINASNKEMYQKHLQSL